MMMRTCLALTVFAALLFGSAASAEPYLAVQEGHKCSTCHVSASGGGMRTTFGNVYSRLLLPAHTLGASNPDAFIWTGEMLKYLKAGANIRASERRIRVPGTPETSERDIDRATVYVAVEPIRGKLLLYADQEFGQGDNFNREAWIRWNFKPSLYIRAGRIFLPFGLRLEDDSAFTRQVPGINYLTPDKGIELGIETGPWAAQFAVSNGTAGGVEIDDGKQVSLSVSYMKSRWLVGGSINFNDSDAGDRELYAAFAGVRTGPVSWLAELDYVIDMGFPEGRRNQLATLLEANWRIRKGVNLKIGYEHLDPDDTVKENQRNRFSGVLEVFPIQFLQLRLGIREYDGIPQSNVQNRTEYFLQTHVFF